jgi:putative hydrolase of HD superfamily
MNYFTNSLLRKVNSEVIDREIKDIWHEHKNSKTLKSKFMCNVTKFKLILQILNYKRVYKHKLDLGEFSWVISRIKLSKVKK